MIISELCSASIVRLEEGAIGAVFSDVVAESRGAAPAAANDSASLTHSTSAACIPVIRKERLKESRWL